MAQPSEAILRLDLGITYQEFSLLANRRKFAGLKLLPPMGVGNISMTNIPKVKTEHMLTARENTEREPYGEYNRDQTEFTRESYNLQDHGVVEMVDDELIRMYSGMFRAEQAASLRAVNRVLQSLEYDIAETINTWDTADAALGTTVAAPWTDFAGSTPIDDLETASDTVEDRTGMTPNTLGMSGRLWRRLIRCAQFENKLDTGSNSAPDQINLAGFRSLFPQFDNIVFWGGFGNTANQANDATLEHIWSHDMAFVGHVHNDGMSGDLAEPIPHVGRTLFLAEDGMPAVGADDGAASLVMEEYREEKRRGGDIRARNHRQIKIWHPEAAQLIRGVGPAL